MKKKKLLTAIAILSIVFLAGCKKDDFVGVVGVCPLVVSTNPINGVTNVPLTKVITATFNEQMNPSTITGTSFTVQEGSTPVAGTVTYSGTTATFTPSSKLDPSTTFTGKITTSAKDLMGNAIQTDFVWTFSTGAIAYPTVISTDPSNLATLVSLNKVVAATFNMKMDPTTITATTVTLKQGTTAIAGTVAYVDSTVTFTPTVALTPNTVYTGTITTGAKNPLGYGLQANYVWTFTTDPSPTVTSTNPANNATGVALNKVVAATFSVLMNQLTITTTTFTIKQGTTLIAGTVAYSGSTATFTPTTPFTANTVYTGTITTGAKNLQGTPLASNYVWTFTTANSSSYTLNITATNGSVAKNPNQLTYNSGNHVIITATPNSGYTFSSWSGDTTGTANPFTVNMNSNKNITANFVVATAQGPGDVNLGTAANYTVLSKSGISNTGVSSITGDIGVSPIAATGITGFSLIMDPSNQFSTSIYVTGKVYASDYATPTPATLTTAINDMQTALTTANGITTNVIVGLGAGDISGMTLAPGLYKWSTGVLITNAGVTLSGGPNDTWVFQIAQGLTVDNSAIVHLTGGAQAKNVFWVTSSDATLGTNVNFSGNILSQTLISLNTGATVTGRLLAQSAVTLNASTVVIP